MIQSCLLKLATVWLQDCSTSNVQNSVLYLKQQKNKTPVFMTHFKSRIFVTQFNGKVCSQ